jgi:hypothetical protein
VTRPLDEIEADLTAQRYESPAMAMSLVLDIPDLIARVRRAEADADRLAAFVRRLIPFGAWERWGRDGNADDAVECETYDRARAEALDAHDAEVEART